MIKYLIIILSFILDFLVLNFSGIPYLHPMFALISVVGVYKLFGVKKEYSITTFILAVLYGIIFLNNIGLSLFLFLLIKEIVVFTNYKFNMSFIKELILIILSISLFNVLIFLFLFVPFSVLMFLSYLLNCLFLNIFLFIIMYLLIRFCSKYS